MTRDTALATQWAESIPDCDLDGAKIRLADFEDQVTLTTLKPDLNLSLEAYRSALNALADRIRRQNGKPSITLLRLLDYSVWRKANLLPESQISRALFVSDGLGCDAGSR